MSTPTVSRAPKKDARVVGTVYLLYGKPRTWGADGWLPVHRKCTTCSRVSATFAPSGESHGLRCASCRVPGDVNMKARMCSVCHRVKPSFGPEGTKKGVRCSGCRHPSDVNVVMEMCSVCQKVIPSFGPEGTSKGLRCGSCRIEGDVNVKTEMCAVCQKVAPHFGPKGTKKGLRCSGCRLENDVDVVTELCSVCHNVRPSFGPQGTRKRLRCAGCRIEGDVDVMAELCSVCHNVRPSFGPQGTKKGLRCGGCRLIDDVNVMVELCAVCQKIVPSFAPQGGKKGLRCSDCRLKDDVNVMSPMCDAPECKTQATYGLLYSKPTRCAKHATVNNVRLLPKRLLNPRCSTPNCKERPCCTDQPNNYPLRCEDHKLPADQNVVHSTCTQCNMQDFIKAGNVCNTCILFETRKHEKKKELMVKVILEAEKVTFIHDRRPENGCGKARPDFIIDCGTHIILLEIDEHQHRSSNYPCECEQVRTINLFQEFGGMKVMFIRFNPDTYTDSAGRKGKGSSSANLKRLITLVRYSMANIPKDPLAVRYLCFDGDNGKYEEFSIDYEAHIASQVDVVAM